MPHLREAGKDAEAIAHFLASRSSGTSAESAKGDAAAGKDLFHSIGCVACHSPADKPLPGSVPLTLGRQYRKGALAAFLLDPVAVRPAGRMPDMRLSTTEAANLEAYLNAQPTKRQTPDPKLIDRGKAAFDKHGCAACHQSKRPAVPIETSTGGCLAEVPLDDVPDFRLSTNQRAAIVLAMGKLTKATSIVDTTLEAFNCYACHQRGDKGGVIEARQEYFHANDPNKEAIGDLGKFPPGLHVTGRKLTATWLERIVSGDGGEVRPYLKTRMPRFPREAVAGLLKAWPEEDRRKEPIAGHGQRWDGLYHLPRLAERAGGRQRHD
jgi:mono/diheme cytochrome c family protein